MELAVGSIVTGKVTTITKFGAFVALPDGKSGLVHISEVAATFVNDVHDFLTEGQEVQVKILSVTPEGKINLSIKQTQPRAPRPPCPGAEGTREIAAVRNFQIDTAEHPAAPFHIFLNCYCTIPGGGNTRPGRMGTKNQDPRPDRGS